VNAGLRMNNHGRLKIITQDEKGEVIFNIPKGSNRIAFKKVGYQAILPTVYYAELGKEKTITITLKEVTTAILSGKVIQKSFEGVNNAKIIIRKNKKETVFEGYTNSKGEFGPLELSVKPTGYSESRLKMEI
jgi:hypothetical protein